MNNGRHIRYLKLCLKLAAKSTSKHYKHYKHGSVLVRGGRVIGTGINRNNKPGKLRYKFYGKKAFHAELDVLSKFSVKKAKRATLYVAGINKNGKLINSCPCENCKKLISLYSLKAVYFCDEKGNVNILV